MVDYDKKENAHFLNKYQIHTKALVLDEFKNGEEVRWENLHRVWELLNSEEAFKTYVRDGVHDFMGDQS